VDRMRMASGANEALDAVLPLTRHFSETP
jgi:hypothetical protein